MSEVKEYINKEQDAGSIRISEDVIASITSVAVKEVEGVYGLSGNLGNDIANMLGKRSQDKGVKLVLTENSVAVECNIIVKFNASVIEVAKAVQECVSNAIEAMTGIRVDLVNVNVCGVAVPKAKPNN